MLIKLLKPDAGSKTGNLESTEEPVSVCADGSVSMRAMEALTSTFVVTSAIFSVKLRLMGTVLRTSTGSLIGAKPGAVIRISYMFWGTLLNRNAPVISVATA